MSYQSMVVSYRVLQSLRREGGGEGEGGGKANLTLKVLAKGPKVITIFRAVQLMNTCGCVLKL